MRQYGNDKPDIRFGCNCWWNINRFHPHGELPATGQLLAGTDSLVFNNDAETRSPFAAPVGSGIYP